MYLRKLSKRDWPWVQEWFEDAELNRRLGPMDQEWCDAALADRDGVQFVTEIDRQPVALIGCIWDPTFNLPHAVTDIAVAPDKRNERIGSRALELVLNSELVPPAKLWVAYVEKDNYGAYALFSRNGWRDAGIFPANGMIRFERES